jgi:hypothetical protein
MARDKYVGRSVLLMRRNRMKTTFARMQLIVTAFLIDVILVWITI